MHFAIKFQARIITFLISIIAFAFLLPLIANPSYAGVNDTCSTFSTTPDYKTWTLTTRYQDISNMTIGQNPGIANGTKLYVYIDNIVDELNGIEQAGGTAALNGTISFVPDTEASWLIKEGSHTIFLDSSYPHHPNNTICTIKYSLGVKCSLISSRNTGSSYGPGENVWINGTFWYEDANGNQTRQQLDIDLRLWNKNNIVVGNQANGDHKDSQTDSLGNFSGNLLIIPSVINSTDIGWWKISASKNNPSESEKQTCTAPICVTQTSGEPTTNCGTPPGPSSGGTGKNPCIGGKCNTAIGSIDTDPTAFVGRILTIAISLAGGIALIIMVIGSVKVLMSANDPQRVANGRDMIIAALAGLLFLIFSVLILRYLGSDLFGFFTVT